MALADILQQRVRASKADSDDEMEASTSPSDLEVIRGAKNSDQQAIDSSGEDIVIADQPKGKSKRRVVTGQPRIPGQEWSQYVTEKYAPYNMVQSTLPTAVNHKFVKFSDYNHYQLYSNPTLTDLNSIPTAGVRIDDLTISRLLGQPGWGPARLHRNWPADIDLNGMVRASRMPLGYAAKMWVAEGDMDINGNVAQADQAGWYYKWWGSIHCLMGREGQRAGMYLIRPSFEKRLPGFGFKLEYKAVIQLPEGVDGSELDSEEDRSSISASPPPSPQQALSTISFGALASAQASLGRKRKRPSSSSHTSRQRSPSPFGEAAERLEGKKDHRLHSRTSKHAPTELSSKKAVSRKRPVLHTPRIAYRDPRFEALSGPLDNNKMEKNYAFLNDYRSSEIAALKASIRSAKDLAMKEGLKRDLLSMESREKARKAKELAQDVLREHRKREKEAVRKGKKPFFLKKGERKKLALIKRFKGMGEKKVERVIERRRKKKAAKERRGMPMARREVEEKA